jgi:hypothetical protein
MRDRDSMYGSIDVIREMGQGKTRERGPPSLGDGLAAKGRLNGKGYRKT